MEQEQPDFFTWLPPEIEHQIIMPALDKLPIVKEMVASPVEISTQDFDAIDFNPYRPNYLMVGDKKQLVRYDPKKKCKEGGAILGKSIASLRYSKKTGENIFAVSVGNKIFVDNNKTTKTIATTGNDYVPSRVRFLADAAHVVEFKENVINCYDINAGDKPCKIFSGDQRVSGVTGINEQQFLYWGDQNIVVHDNRQDKPSNIHTINAHAVEPSLNENILAIGKNRNGAALIDRRKNQEVASFTTNSDAVTVIEYNPHNPQELLAACGGKVHVIDTEKEKVTKIHGPFGSSSVLLRHDPFHENVIVVGGYEPCPAGVNQKVSIIDLDYGTDKNKLLNEILSEYEISVLEKDTSRKKCNQTRLIKLYTLLLKLDKGWSDEKPCQLTHEEAAFINHVMPPYTQSILEKYGVVSATHPLSQSSTASLS